MVLHLLSKKIGIQTITEKEKNARFAVHANAVTSHQKCVSCRVKIVAKVSSSTYAFFVVLKVPIVLCCRYCFPPPKPTWNTSFYLAISIVRNVVYTVGELRSLKGIRLISNGGPPPFVIPRGLKSKRGDSLEKGASMPAYEFTYSDDDDLTLLFPSDDQKIPLPSRQQGFKNNSRKKYILFIHGGAFCWQSIASHRMLCYAMAKETGANVLSIEYRKAPEFPYPIPGRDCFAAYKWLLDKVGDSSRIVVAGDSAGGALAVDIVIQAREAQIPRPGGCILMSPWVRNWK